MDISYLHVFTYSERSGTKAAEMKNIVPVDVRRDRNTQLTNLSLKKKYSFYSQFIGTERKVLVEKSKEKNIYTGFTDNYIKVKFHSDKNLENKIVNVHLEKLDNNYIIWGKSL